MRGLNDVGAFGRSNPTQFQDRLWLVALSKLPHRPRARRGVGRCPLLANRVSYPMTQLEKESFNKYQPAHISHHSPFSLNEIYLVLESSCIRVKFRVVENRARSGSDSADSHPYIFLVNVKYNIGILKIRMV
jgi:hypothetical protein